MLDSLVETKDGQHIAARFFRPQGEPKDSVLIVPAMGVTQDYYQPFASWLATQGFIAATFDYRGTGLSRPRFYTCAPRTLKRIAPRDIGVARIGHFGFFRAAFESSLWRPHLLLELG